MSNYEVKIINGEMEVGKEKNWVVTSDMSEYDAIHAVAGAILAGADQVQVEKYDN